MKAMRQSRSGTFQPIRPPTMPLMPAMRPVESINSAAERPISAPPRAAESGVKLAIGNLVCLARQQYSNYARAHTKPQRRKAFPMDFALSSEIDDIRKRTRAFVEQHVLPLEAD